MRRELAEFAHRQAVLAISELNEIAKQYDFIDESEIAMKRSIGLVMGDIQVEILNKIWVHHPDLNDLVEPDS